jgi:SAM-dependent methyltransferase
VTTELNTTTAGVLPLVDRRCPLCDSAHATAVWTTADRAFGVPGRYRVVQCRSCRFLYQNPRVRDEDLAACYPDHYPRHQEASPRIPFKGSPRRLRAVRWVLARQLGYEQFREPASWLTRLRAALLSSRLTWDCPPWVGRGRHLDVGCGSGGTLAVSRSLGWATSGLEVDSTAAAKARQFADEVYSADVLSAPIEPGQFDLVSAFHVLEHVPDPVAMIRRMLLWLAPGGLLIIEVPNAGGVGARLFGAAWSSLELPRHLSHFAPDSLERAVTQAGGRIVWERHQSKPREYLRSLRNALADRGWHRMAAVTTSPWVRGPLKLVLEVVLPLTAKAGRGEVVRIGVRPGEPVAIAAGATPAPAAP